MDLGTSIIGATCAALCAMPFILTSRNKKKKEKELLNSLKDLAKQNGSEINEYETSGFYAIGLDNSKKTVSFVLKRKEKFEYQFVNLSSIKNCEMVDIYKSLANKERIIDKLNLKLNPSDKNKPSIILEFYNSDISFQPVNEFDSIEKWNQLINNLLNKK